MRPHEPDGPRSAPDRPPTEARTIVETAMPEPARRATIEGLAQPQYGVIGRSQLLTAGWSSSSIERAVCSGRLIAIARGVYRADGAPWTRRAAQHAALLIAGNDAVLTRWTAAALHGFAEPRPGPIEVMVGHTRRARRAGYGPDTGEGLLRLTRTRVLLGEERCVIDGMPATSGARTLLDLASVTSTAQLAERVAVGVRVNACTLGQLRRVVENHRNARGRPRLRHVLELLGDDGTDARSDVEVAGLREIVEAGLPRPAVAHRVHDDGGAFVGEVDLAYPELRIAIEIDGFRWHSSPEQKRRDEERQNRLVLCRWTVLRFSANDVRTRPHLLITAIRDALGRFGH